jgi:hypothetical protein
MNVIVSVNVGLPSDINWRGRTLRTALWKQPVIGKALALMSRALPVTAIALDL